jgi:NAD-dependent DNA ligase
LAEVCEEEFCLVDQESGKAILLTKEEKERIFLDAIQSYYVTGKSNLPDDQFDRLREDLSWEGSVLVTLNRNETKFLNAMQAYMKGSPILSDKEFDDLKSSLKETNSKIAVATEPKCYVETGVCKVTWSKRDILVSSLYVPATLFTGLLFIGVVSC